MYWVQCCSCDIWVHVTCAIYTSIMQEDNTQDYTCKTCSSVYKAIAEYSYMYLELSLPPQSSRRQACDTELRTQQICWTWGVKYGAARPSQPGQKIMVPAPMHVHASLFPHRMGTPEHALLELRGYRRAQRQRSSVLMYEKMRGDK